MSKKLCPVYDYLCEAYDGKTCCLIGGTDEPCHH